MAGSTYATFALGGKMFSEFRRTLTLTLALLAAFVFIPLPVIAQSKDPVVPVSMEPDHHIRFDNGKVRVYDVHLVKGKWSQFHEHTWDNFFVFMHATTQAFEFSDGRHGTRQVKTGEVAFASTATGPYAHRVTAEGDTPVHVVDIEILNNAQLGSGVAAAKRPEIIL
jgi:hypothetical protein